MRRIIQIRSNMKRIGNPQCCGSGMFIPDPGSKFIPSRIPDPNFSLPGSSSKNKYFNPKNCFLSSFGNMNWAVPHRIRILIFYPSRIPGSKRHRIPDPQHWQHRILSLQETNSWHYSRDWLMTRQNLMQIFRLLTGRQTLGPYGNDLLHGRREVVRSQVHVEEFSLCRRIPARKGQAL